MSAEGKYSDNENIKISIYKSDGNKKILKILSDRAKPFVQDFKFVKESDIRRFAINQEFFQR